MSTEPVSETMREAVGVFDESENLEAAVDELERAGFDRAELSLLAGADAVEEKLGHIFERVGEVEDDPDAPRAAYVSRDSLAEAKGGLVGGLMYVGALAAAGAVVASGGTASAVVAAIMAGGAGALIGASLAAAVGGHHAKHLQDQLDRGGILLWVHIRDDTHQQRALDILTKHSAHDVHVHEYAPSS